MLGQEPVFVSTIVPLTQRKKERKKERERGKEIGKELKLSSAQKDAYFYSPWWREGGWDKRACIGLNGST